MYNLHYTDDFLILSTGGVEDLRIIKLLLYLFEGMSGLETNFAKTYLFSSRLDQLPSTAESLTLNCAAGYLPVTCLGIPISNRRPRSWTGKSLLLRYGAFVLL